MTFLGIDFSTVIIILKILGIVLSIAFFVGIIISFLGILSTQEKKKERKNKHFIIHKEERSKKHDLWEDIKRHFFSKNPTDWRMAIIDADVMLEDLITSMGYIAPTFGEKLKLLNKSDFPWVDLAWHVHKLRNSLAHQGTSFHLSEREAHQAYKIYEKIFFESKYLS